jgi:hypothetical protein
MNIFAAKTQTQYWRAVSISGQDAGLGAECPVCHGCVRYGLFSDSTFEHCGRREPVPQDIHDLPCRSLKRGMPLLPKGYIVTDTWSDGDSDWDRDSAASERVPWI